MLCSVPRIKGFMKTSRPRALRTALAVAAITLLLPACASTGAGTADGDDYEMSYGSPSGQDGLLEVVRKALLG